MKTHKITKQVVAENSKWFDFFLIAPKVIAIILGVLFFIAGIVFMAIFASYGQADYGVGYMLGFWIGGAIVCGINYVILKLLFSYKILHIYYLKNLVSLKEQENKTTTVNTETPDSDDEVATDGFSEIININNYDFKKVITDNKLTEFIIPEKIDGNSIINIENNAFRDCYGLTSIEIPNSVTSIGHCAFYGCRNLASIIIPNSVTSIGNATFHDCRKLTSINYSGTIEEWNSISKGVSWKYNVPTTCEVNCTDGVINI